MNFKVLLLVFIISILIVGGCSNDSNSNEMNQMQFSEYPEAVAIINNDIIIEIEEVENLIKVATLENQTISIEEAVKIRAESRLLLQEAEQRGIKLSFQEIKELIDSQLEDIEKYNVKDVYSKLIATLGVTEEEFWEELFPQEIIAFETVNRLGNILVQEAINRGELPSKPAYEGAEYFQQYGKNLVNSANIKLNEEFISEFK